MEPLCPLPAHHPPSPWMPVWCAMAPCPAPPAPLEPSAQPWTRSARPAREEEEDVAATAQPRAASRAVPQDRPSAPRPRRARPGWGRELGAARARTVRLVPGGPSVGSQSGTPRACAGLFVAKNRDCVGSSMRGRTRGGVSVRPEPSGWVSGWGASGSARASVRPGIGGFQLGWDLRPTYGLLWPGGGFVCGCARVCLCRNPFPRDVSCAPSAKLLEAPPGWRGCRPVLRVGGRTDIPGS